jgi:hypothetical protein
MSPNEDAKASSPGTDEADAEFNAMRTVYSALKGLDRAAQNRVLDYVCQRLSLKMETMAEERPARQPEPENDTVEAATAHDSSDEEGLEGISPVARKWMRRSGLSGDQLSTLFSLGVDEIDLVAKSVPGKSRAERVRSVLLLLGIAAYLSSGAARVSDEKLREACGHYGAYDPTNFSKHIKAISAEASGSRESGYTLTSRGIAAATELIRQIISGG